MDLMCQSSESATKTLRETPFGMEVDGNLDVMGDISTRGSIFCSSLNPKGRDYAEYFQLAELNDAIAAYQVVGLNIDGKIALQTNGAIQIGVVSSKPSVIAGVETKDSLPVSLTIWPGQVLVQVRGQAKKGDILQISGKSDGTAVAVTKGSFPNRKVIGVVIGNEGEVMINDDDLIAVNVLLDSHAGENIMSMKIRSLETERRLLDNQVKVAMAYVNNPQGKEVHITATRWQTIMRGKLARLLLQRSLCAMIFVQAAVRAHRIRRALRFAKCSIRSRICRLRYARARSSVICLQSVWRGITTRRLMATSTSCSDMVTPLNPTRMKAALLAVVKVKDVEMKRRQAIRDAEVQAHKRKADAEVGALISEKLEKRKMEGTIKDLREKISAQECINRQIAEALSQIKKLRPNPFVAEHLRNITNQNPLLHHYQYAQQQNASLKAASNTPGLALAIDKLVEATELATA
mmetsp:Transcript_39672/g.65771  ORF Transcript_39672/g.65771 Transcript_39672/m.65771 type:complete len:463 (-) Transcript_39672:375-1763(-)